MALGMFIVAGRDRLSFQTDYRLIFRRAMQDYVRNEKRTPRMKQRGGTT